MIFLCIQISHPDEFDVMLPIPVDRVDIKPFGDDGAFYSVALKRGKSPLQKFQETDTLSASEMLKEFRKEVQKCVSKSRGEYQNEHFLIVGRNTKYLSCDQTSNSNFYDGAVCTLPSAVCIFINDQI